MLSEISKGFKVVLVWTLLMEEEDRMKTLGDETEVQNV